MELLKLNPEINKSYIPDRKLGYLEYFNRALVFAQTNYHEHLYKITRLHPNDINATKFLQEYLGAMLSVGKKKLLTPNYYNSIVKAHSIFYKSFWDLNSFPNKNNVQSSLLELNLTDMEFNNIYSTAQIINQGVKLFGWSKYRENFLNSYSKLTVFPGLGLMGAKMLDRNLGGMYCPDDLPELYDLAIDFGFDDAKHLLYELKRNFPLSYRTMGTILWYSVVTFDKTDIVSTD